MIIAGVDLGGAKAAVAVLHDDQLTVKAFGSKAKRRQDQLWEVADFVDRACEGVDVVYIEEPLIGRGVRASLQVAQAAGAVMAQIGPQAHLIPVSAWKKNIVGSGNATKESVAFWLHNEFPHYSELCEEDQDLADATCIALYGRDVQHLADALFDTLATAD